MTWPEEPYRGLGYYGPEHALLFVGRDDDVDACVQFLAERPTRMLLLHGATGCGKSSFLRAGLIPALEEQGFGYQFLRDRTRTSDQPGDRDTDTGEPVFIRCGRDPVSAIAEEVFKAASHPYVTNQTAVGRLELDLSSALLGRTRLQEFVDACDDPSVLLEVLAQLSRLLLHTLVIVIDQAEEVITLTQPLDEERRRFFRFLQDFNARTINIKFVIALRREDFGEFLSYLQIDASLKNDVKHFPLKELNYNEVLRAIELPTQKTDWRGYGPPFKKYGFEFEPGLPEQITSQLFAALPSGGVPIVMQIVCQDLYNQVTKPNNQVIAKPEPRLIDMALYDTRKGLAGIVDDRISSALQDAILQMKPGPDEPEREERGWRAVLYRMVRRSTDGTVKTDEVSHDHLISWAEQEGLSRNPGQVLERLTNPGLLILRRRMSRNEEYRYTLGHDAIALALHEWMVREAEAQRQRQLREEEEQQLQERERIRRQEEESRWREAQRKARRLRNWMTGAIALTLVSAFSLAAGMYSNGKATKSRVLMSAAERLLQSDYGLGVWAAVQAIQETVWIPAWFLPNEPGSKAVLARLLAAGPIKKISPPDDERSSAFLLPITGQLVFADSHGHASIVRVSAMSGGDNDTKKIVLEAPQRLNLSAQLDDPGASSDIRYDLEMVSELPNGAVVLQFQQLEPNGTSRTEVIVVRDPQGAIKMYSTADLVGQSDRLKQRIAYLRDSGQQRDPSSSPSILLDGQFLYVYVWAPKLVVDLFVVDTGAPTGLRHGVPYDENVREMQAKSKMTAAAERHFYAVSGYIVIQEATTDATPPRHGSGTGRGQFRMVQIMNLRSDPGPVTNAKEVWDDIAAGSPTLRECNQQPNTAATCTVRTMPTSGNSQLMVLLVTVESKQTSTPISKLVVVDMDSFRSVDVDVPSTDFSDIGRRLIVVGTPTHMILGLPQDQSMSLYRVEYGSSSTIGIVAWDDDVEGWAVTPDQQLLLGVSGGYGLAWSLAQPPKVRAKMLAKWPLDDLLRIGANWVCSPDLRLRPMIGRRRQG